MQLELDHFAIGVHSVERAGPWVERSFGAVQGDGGPSPAFFWRQWSFANGGVLELIEPLGAPGGFMHRFMERHGPAVHHVTFRVPSLAGAAERARAAGYEVVGYDDSHPSWKECFLHPKQAQGIVVQLAESAGTHAVPAARSGVELRALRLRAKSEEAALAQWSGLLGGEVTRTGEGLAFRWPASPIAIAVRIDAALAEGPQAIELVSADAIAFDASEARTTFGTPFEVARG